MNDYDEIVYAGVHADLCVSPNAVLRSSVAWGVWFRCATYAALMDRENLSHSIIYWLCPEDRATVDAAVAEFVGLGFFAPTSDGYEVRGFTRLGMDGFL